MATRLRIHSIRSTNAAGSGHPTSCSSIAEIMSVLFYHVMRYKVSDPRDPASDRFILSKGHAAPILYAAWAEAGLFPIDDILNLRKIDSDLEGHPTPRLSFVDVATGSLGQGLSCAAGMAFVGKYIDKSSYRIYCVIGDGESAEGSVWEAISFASHYKLDNLVAIFDVNRLGQSEPTSLQHNTDAYKARLEAFGATTCVVDGHNITELCKKLDDAKKTKGYPSVIIAKTFKGKGFPDIEDQESWHGKPLGTKGIDIIKVLQEELSKNESASKKPDITAPENELLPVSLSDIKLQDDPSYTLGEKVATRMAYGTALTKLGANNDRIIALDGDTKNSTYAIKFREKFPDRFIECFIAEQNLVGVAVGASCRARTIPFVSTFATFFTRAMDQLRMAAISQANIKCCGSHCGVSIGEDGPSQMGLEDLAVFRSLPGSTVFYPSDAVSTERACELAANKLGICYIRTSRPETPVIYENSTVFQIGKAQVVKKSDKDQVLVVGAGVTLHEAIQAAEKLEAENIHVRVLDPFTIKPIDKDGIIHNARQCGGRIISVEDHYPEGGLGDAVSEFICNEKDITLRRLAVTGLPRSGPGDILLELFGISSQRITQAIKDTVL
ncbi:LOW QUALITY PROTEIN: transketolase-like [Uloborus diversus]|uniref:LOW QUALITY PROTEIN: transketolase-like n=1 Tax=Uloborus diversus TaxID=327109 RepID=UPI00240904BA|nr:LOW QUALITY PROTEIN: transketolase-like [Uloborus diversus]